MSTLKSSSPKGNQTALIDADLERIMNSVEVKHHDGHILLPNDMKVSTAIEVLNRRQKSLEEIVMVHEIFECFPWDGAIALQAALEKRFGWTPPPKHTVRIEVGFDKTTTVLWGDFALPEIDAEITARMLRVENQIRFAITGSIKRMHEHVLREVCEMVRRQVRDHSIYQGAAFSIVFHDPNTGDLLDMPLIKFLDVSKVHKDNLILSEDVMKAVNTNLFTPIERMKDLENMGVPVKRGVLLGGKYGTGKTLAMAIAGRLATEQGMTYMYLPDTQDLSLAISFAQNYQNPGAMIAAEDIDRVISGDEDDRTQRMDFILNTLDGVNNKGKRTMVVLTSNNMDSIQPAMLRPGRLDAVIEVTPPDAKAAARLLRLYGGNTLAHDVDLDTAGKEVAGMIPAMIAEVAQRAKLSQLSITPVGQPVSKITTEALIESARTFRRQLEMIERVSPEISIKQLTLARAFNMVGLALYNGLSDQEWATANTDFMEKPALRKTAA